MKSWIQQHILLELTKNGAVRYSDLKPADVEGNLFMYHLKGLLRQKIVEKREDGYHLTASGLREVATLSLKTGKSRQQPQILNAIVAVNERQEWLFVRWKRQPNKGLISLPHGMMHYGKGINEMAHQELAEKAGLQADLAYQGDVYARVERDGEVERHMLVHVFKAQNIQSGKEQLLRPELAESFWAPLSAVKHEESIPGFYEIAQIVAERPGHFFEEVVVQL